ncbi:MAG: FHA domain-containing protein [Myxococcales bacterium]|nr:FHA domain-containing protein [Myxococcales bacterium]
MNSTEATINPEERPAFSLVVRRGRRGGREFRLGDALVRIGAARSCEISIKGEYVDDEHAHITRRGVLWSLENKSVNGTLVNGERVDVKILEPGDLIQIGGETLLEFSLVTKKEPRRKKRSRKGDRKPRSGMFANPLIVGGIGAYLALLVAGGIYFALRGSAGSDAGFSAERASSLIQTTLEFLASPELLRVPPSDAPAFAAKIDGSADPGASFYRLLNSRPRDGDETERERQLGAIEEQLRAGFANAWFLEQQGRNREAIRSYEEIQAVVPDGRAPTTRAAAARAAELRSTLER